MNKIHSETLRTESQIRYKVLHVDRLMAKRRIASWNNDWAAWQAFNQELKQVLKEDQQEVGKKLVVEFEGGFLRGVNL